MAIIPGPVQDFIDSSLGQVTGNVLHTLGAIGFLGGLALYLGWYRMLRRGEHHENVLVGAAFATYAAIVANFLGGAMRNLQTGHPGLTAIAHEPWVRVIFVKHLFLFAASGAAIYLFQAVVPRLLRAHKAGALGSRPAADHAIGTIVVALGIVIATVLGAVGQITPIHALEDEEGGEGPVVVAPSFQGVRWANATGLLTSTPVAPATSTGTIEVPNGTARLDSTMTWTPTQFTLSFTWTGPEGQVAASTPDGDGRALSGVAAPLPGTWRYEITSEMAIDAAWDLTTRLTAANDTVTVLAETVTVPPGQFFEINTEMPEGASFTWDWTASQAVAFDVHSHFDDEVQYHVEKTTDADRGTFTNDREGGYSLLWENTGAVPVTLDYRVSGDFEVHSYFPPR